MRFLLGFSYSRKATPSVGNDINGWANKLVAYLKSEFQLLEAAVAPTSSRSVTAATTVTVNDGLILVDATSAPVTVTFPAPSGVADLVVTVKKIDSSANAVTLAATIDGVASPTLASQYKAKTVWAYAPAGKAAAYYTVATV